MDQRHALISLLVVVLLTIAGYRVAVTVPWLYEDAHVGSSQLSLSIPGRGLTEWSLRATAGSPAVAHGANLALHLVAGLLVAWIAFVVAGPVASVLAAMTQLWHPLNSQAVWYVTGRSDLLMTIGVLAAVSAALARRPWRWVGIALGLLVAALSKEVGVVGVPVVLLTLLAWRPTDLSSHAASALWIGTGASIGGAWHTLASWVTLGPGVGGPDVPWTEFVVRQVGLLWALLLTIDPRGFAIDHDALALTGPWLIGSALLTGLVATTTVIAWRRCRPIGWALAVVALSCVPRLMVPTNEFLAERQMYLPMAGLAILTGYLGAWWLSARAPRHHGSFLSSQGVTV